MIKRWLWCRALLTVLASKEHLTESMDVYSERDWLEAEHVANRVVATYIRYWERRSWW